jgi:flagellar basal-body rod modification protein FlgD
MSTTTPTVTTPLSDLPQLTTATTPTSGSNELGKDAFMKLLIEQMKDQDPTNPVDNSQMIAQLAQFSQLEELQTLSSKVDGMAVATASSSQLATTQLVGKQVLFHADRIGLQTGSTSTFQLSLPQATDDTTAVIADSSGKVVRTLHLGPHAAGASQVAWDGLDDSGKALPSGEYLLSVAGTRNDGTTVSATADVRATITGVAYDSGVAHLIVAGRHVPMSDVVEITAPPAGP